MPVVASLSPSRRCRQSCQRANSAIALTFDHVEIDAQDDGLRGAALRRAGPGRVTDVGLASRTGCNCASASGWAGHCRRRPGRRVASVGRRRRGRRAGSRRASTAERRNSASAKQTAALAQPGADMERQGQRDGQPLIGMMPSTPFRDEHYGAGPPSRAGASAYLEPDAETNKPGGDRQRQPRRGSWFRTPRRRRAAQPHACRVDSDPPTFRGRGHRRPRFGRVRRGARTDRRRRLPACAEQPTEISILAIVEASEGDSRRPGMCAAQCAVLGRRAVRRPLDVPGRRRTRYIEQLSSGDAGSAVSDAPKSARAARRDMFDDWVGAQAERHARGHRAHR